MNFMNATKTIKLKFQNKARKSKYLYEFHGFHYLVLPRNEGASLQSKLLKDSKLIRHIPYRN
jgi:hypothetical protein